MTIEEAKDDLARLGFLAVTGTMAITFGDPGKTVIVEPVLGVEVSDTHQCFEAECGPVHLIGTKTALGLMSINALRKLVTEQLWNNR